MLLPLKGCEMKDFQHSNRIIEMTKVIKLMKQYGLDTKDELLVLNITIIYIEAQKDQLEEAK